MPVINFAKAKNVNLGIKQAIRVYAGEELKWEAMKKRLFYDSASGEPFDVDGLKMNEKIIVIPKKDFPLDLMEKEENPFGTNPDKVDYSFDIVTMDILIGSWPMPQAIEISLRKHKDLPFNPTNDTVWSLYNPKKTAEEQGQEVANIKFVADWIDKIYIVEE